MPAFCFSVDGNHFKNGNFRKRQRSDNHVVSSTDYVFLKHKHKKNRCRIVAFFSKFLRCSVDGKTFYPFSCVDEKHLMSFQSETSVFSFLWRSQIYCFNLSHIKRKQNILRTNTLQTTNTNTTNEAIATIQQPFSRLTLLICIRMKPNNNAR